MVLRTLFGAVGSLLLLLLLLLLASASASSDVDDVDDVDDDILRRQIATLTPLMAVLRVGRSRTRPLTGLAVEGRSLSCGNNSDILDILSIVALALGLFYLILLSTTTTTAGRRKRDAPDDVDIGKGVRIQSTSTLSAAFLFAKDRPARCWPSYVPWVQARLEFRRISVGRTI